MVKRQIWRQCFVNLVEHSFSKRTTHTHTQSFTASLSLSLCGNIFPSSIRRRLKYPIRWCFHIFLFGGDDKRVYFDHIENEQKVRSDPSYSVSVLSSLKHFRLSFVFVNKKRMKFRRKNMINRRLAKRLWWLCLSSINMTVCVCAWVPNKIDLRFIQFSIYNILLYVLCSMRR